MKNSKLYASQEDSDLLEIAQELVRKYHDTNDYSVILNINKRNFNQIENTKKDVMEQISTILHNNYECSDSDEKEIMDLVEKEIWGYGIVDQFINDSTISDIKIYNADNIRIKKEGKRKGVPVKFKDEAAYNVFVNKIIEANGINLGTASAIQTFTDDSQKSAILRISIVSNYLTSSKIPCIAIRKIPKNKMSLVDLQEKGMMSPVVEKKKTILNNAKTTNLMDLLAQIVNSKGVLFTGKGASGKTTLMNAMIEKIPYDESVMVCQENSELFDYRHPDMLTTHISVNSGDSKVSYTLGDLTRQALLIDLDRIIIGEIKDSTEAEGLAKASITGHKCWTSVHGESCEMAIELMADYINKASDIGIEKAMRQLLGFEYVIYMKNFQINEIKRIAGWNKETSSLILEKVYPFE